MLTRVEFQIQTPRTYASLPAQVNALEATAIPLEALTEKIGVGTPTSVTAIKTSPTQVTYTVMCPLLFPLFDQVFPPGSDPIPTLENLLVGVVETQNALRFVQGSAVLLP